MEKQQCLVITVVILMTILESAAAMSDLGYSIQRYDESPGLYYKNKGIAVLYNMEWKTIVYVDLNKVDNETLRQYVHHVEMLC
jgi:hypothetical protein